MDETNKENYILIGLAVVLMIFGGITIYPAIRSNLIGSMDMQAVTGNAISLEPVKTARYYYDMFQCACCGKPIDANCCGMSKQGKAYLDKILSEEADENEVMYRMVKKFGFNVLMDQSKEQDVKNYIISKAPDDPPVLEIETDRFDFGTLSQADGVVSTEFKIINAGKSDLVIEGLDTSCMCTTASIVYNGVEGPVFGMSMHGDNPEDYSLTILPGESAQLKVYFDPMAHGVQKKPEVQITREVTIISNDPVNFQKRVRIELIQVP